MDSQKSILITLFILINVVIYSNNVLPTKAKGPPTTIPDSGQCMDLMVNNMATCISFLSKGSTDSKPDTDCCTGLKVVLDTNEICLCQGLKDSASFGVDLDIERAKVIAPKCNINAPPVSKCDEIGSSATAPSQQGGPSKQKPATPSTQPIPPPPSTSTKAPSPSPPTKSSKPGPSTSPSASSTLGPSSSSPPPTPETGSSPSPPTSSATSPSPSSSSSSSSQAPSEIPPTGSSSPSAEAPSTTTTTVPSPSPSTEADTTSTTTTASPPPKSSSASIIIPYAVIASCNVFLHLFT